MATSAPTGIEVADSPADNRYELRVDGELAGFAAYRLVGERVVFTHTEVADAFKGRGLGGRLVRGALDDVRARGLRATPECEFVSAFLAGQQEYADLVEAPHRVLEEPAD